MNLSQISVEFIEPQTLQRFIEAEKMKLKLIAVYFEKSNAFNKKNYFV